MHTTILYNSNKYPETLAKIKQFVNEKDAFYEKKVILSIF